MRAGGRQGKKNVSGESLIIPNIVDNWPLSCGQLAAFVDNLPHYQRLYFCSSSPIVSAIGFIEEILDVSTHY